MAFSCGPLSLGSAPDHLKVTFRDLVQKVYTSKAPDEIQASQAQLHDLQRGPYAFALSSDVFHQSDDPRVKFFAALTIAIRLNHDPDVSEDELDILLRQLLQWLLQSVSEGLPPFVLRRMCSTIVTIYLIPQMSLSRIVAFVCSCFATGTFEKVDSNAQIHVADMTRHLPDKPLKALLEFTVILAEELREVVHHAQSDRLHQRAVANLTDVSVMLHVCYERNLLREQLTSACIMSSCHLQWIKYSKTHVSANSENHQRFCDLLRPAMQFLELAIEDEDEFEAITRLFEKTLKDTNIRLKNDLLDDFLALLQSSLGELFLGQIADGQATDDCTAFGIMVLAYCKRCAPKAFLPDDPQTDVARQDAVTGPGFLSYCAAQRESSVKLAMQVSLSMSCEDFDETLAHSVIGFWDDFVQETRTHKLREEAGAYAIGILDTMCPACRLPADQSQNSNDSEVVMEVRMCVRDLAQVMCEEYGMRVIEQLTTMLDKIWSHSPADEGTETDKWGALEPALYLLTELGESVQFATEVDEDSEDRASPSVSANHQILSMIFNSSWFTALLVSEHHIPSAVRILGTKLIKEFQQYFHGQPDMLRRVLDVLMRHLRDDQLAPAAADAIKSLCEENRAIMAQAEQQNMLLELTEQYFNYHAAALQPKKAIVAATVSVAEGMKDEERKDLVINTLLDVITHNHDKKLSTLNKDPTSQALAAEETLELLVSMGGGSQTLEEELSTDKIRASSRWHYWTSGPGTGTQDRIMNLIEVALRTRNAFEIHLDKACNVLRTGYREILPGPFVFSPTARTTFITSVPFAHPQMEAVAKLAADLICQERFGGGHEFSTSHELFAYFLQAIAHLQHPRSDPVLAFAYMHVFNKSPDRLRLICELPAAGLDLLLSFMLNSLSVPEPLPKRAACDFWHNLVANHGVYHEPANHNVGRLSAIVRQAGPHLATALVGNLGGNANRSELNSLADLLRALVKGFPETKAWLTSALANPEFPSQRVGDTEKRRFAESAIMLRGALKTREVVKNFWLECRGTPAGYG